MGDLKNGGLDKGKSDKDTIFCWTNDSKYKIVLVGDSGVGKTSVFWQYIEEYFPEDVEELKVTMVDFKIKNIVIDNELIKLYIWDTAGQERYRSLISNYFKGTHGIVLLFDLGSSSSFESIRTSWINICREKSPDAIFILVGNKSDIAKRAVSSDRISQFVEENQLRYFEASAFDGSNINESFEFIANAIKNKFFKKPESIPQGANNQSETQAQPQQLPSGGSDNMNRKHRSSSISLKAQNTSTNQTNQSSKDKQSNCPC